uniref:Uncharacterized protein n=1 Tax=Candidatus Kentrum sp. LFY TaxID=2126342 RepID=A0A450WX71_9GAMM|nr:MAG: hypothetical protein BECKLFY1418C_GA0070996_10989 [Candidatus Kentron sp. LFY]
MLGPSLRVIPACVRIAISYLESDNEISVDYGVTLRMVNTSSYRFLSSFLGSTGALLVGTAMGLAAEASDYNYAGSRQSQSWDRQGSTTADYATRWGRGTKPWFRKRSNTARSGFNDWGNRASMDYDTPRTENVTPINRRNWRREQSTSYSDNLWPSTAERPHVPAREEHRVGEKQKTEQWISSDGQRNSWEDAGSRRRTDPWAKRSQPSFKHRNNRRSTGASWPKDAKARDFSGAYYGDTKPRWRDWSRLPISEKSSNHSTDNYQSPATQNRWTGNNSRRDSKPYMSASDLSRHENWKRDRENSGEKKQWRAHSHTNSSQNKQQFRSNLIDNTNNTPPVNPIQQRYPEYPGYYSGYSYPSNNHMPFYSGVGGNRHWYGHYPGYNYGWLGDLYTDQNFPMLDDSPWFLF